MIEKIVATKEFPSVLLLFGEEDFLVEQAATQLFAAAKTLDDSGMSTDILDADGMSLDAIISLARSYPMMSNKRVIWARRLDKVQGGKQKGQTLSSYLSDPMSTTILILTASIPSAAGISAMVAKSSASAQRKIKGLKFPFDALIQNAQWIEYPSLKASQAVQWILKRAPSYGIQISQHLCEYLVERNGTSLRELDLELDKVATFVGKGQEVTEDVIAHVAGGSREFSVFELQRAVGRGNLASASAILEGMLASDRQELLIVAMLHRYFTTLFKLIDARTTAGNSPNAIASAVGIPPSAVGDHLDAIDRLGVAAIERALNQLRYAEAMMKSSSIEPRTILQTVLLSLLKTQKNSPPVSLKAFGW